MVTATGTLVYQPRTFLVATMAASWSLWGGLLLSARLGLIKAESLGALYAFGVLAPSAVAFALSMTGGLPAVRALAARGLRWRVPARWYGYAIMMPIGLRLAGLGLFGLSGGTLLPNPIAAPQVVVAAAIGLVVGAMEEFGWRGYLQPAIWQQNSQLGTALRVGAAWAIWHLPLFWMPGTGFHRWASAAGWPFAVAGYGVAVVALSLLITCQFAGTHGSVWMAMVFHSAVNTSSDALFAPYNRIGNVGPLWWSVFVLAAAGGVAAWALRRRDLRPLVPAHSIGLMGDSTQTGPSSPAASPRRPRGIL